MALSSLARRLAPAARPVWVVLGILAVAALGHGLGSRELSLLNRTELVLWLGLPGALAGCAGVCVSLTGERAAAALLAAVALVASLAFGELGLTVKAFLGAAGGRDAGGPGAADALAAARTAGRELVPSLSLVPVFRGAGPGRLVSRLAGEQGELLPLGGIANAETIYCRRDGGWLSYRSDEQGFRNPPESWAALPAAAILLGDSFVQGHCVGDDAELGQRLRARLGRVINLGIGGRGPLFQLAALAEYGPLLRPRLVLWFFVEGDDVEDDLAHERQSALLLSYLQPGFRQGLLARSPEVGAALVALGEQARATPFKDDGGALTAFRHALTLSQLRYHAGLTWQALRPADYPLFRRVLERARQIAGEWGGTVVLVNLAQQPNLARKQRGDASRELPALARALDLQVIDLVAPFRASGRDDLFVARDGHYTEAGYALAGEIIAGALAAR